MEVDQEKCHIIHSTSYTELESSIQNFLHQQPFQYELSEHTPNFTGPSTFRDVCNIIPIDVLWNTVSSVVEPFVVQLSAVPYVVMGRMTYKCIYGQQIHDQEGNDSKATCPLSFTAFKTISFPRFALSTNDEREKLRMVNEVRKRIHAEDKNKIILSEYQVQLPWDRPHRHHQVITIQNLVNHLISKRISSLLANGGNKSVKHLEMEVLDYVVNVLYKDKTVPGTLWRENGTIRHEISTERMNAGLINIQEENMLHLLPALKSANVFFQPTTKCDDNDSKVQMMFVYQSEDMQRLYQRYGHTILHLHSTYRTIEYMLPLYYILVQTNSTLQVVAVIVIQEESQDLLTRALLKIQEWNPNVIPDYGMCRLDVGEIASLETVYSNIRVYICEVQRELSWKQWVSVCRDIPPHESSTFFKKLEHIAESTCEEELDKCLQDLFGWRYFKGNVKSWFEKIWYPELKRWCCLYKPDDLISCYPSTRGRDEGILGKVKEDMLRTFKNAPLCFFLSVLIVKCLPDVYEQYEQYNVDCAMAAVGTESEIPLQFRDLPLSLICLIKEHSKNISANPIRSVCERDDGMFTVIDALMVDDSASSDVVSEHIMCFGDEFRMPSCTCSDFRKSRLPCRHFVAVLESGKKTIFDLSPRFLNHPFTNIDNDVLESKRVDSFIGKFADVDREAQIKTKEDDQYSGRPDNRPPVTLELVKNEIIPSHVSPKHVCTKSNRNQTRETSAHRSSREDSTVSKRNKPKKTSVDETGSVTSNRTNEIAKRNPAHISLRKISSTSNRNKLIDRSPKQDGSVSSRNRAKERAPIDKSPRRQRSRSNENNETQRKPRKRPMASHKVVGHKKRLIRENDHDSSEKMTKVNALSALKAEMEVLMTGEDSKKEEEIPKSIIKSPSSLLHDCLAATHHSNEECHLGNGFSFSGRPVDNLGKTGEPIIVTRVDSIVPELQLNDEKFTCVSKRKDVADVDAEKEGRKEEKNISAETRLEITQTVVNISPTDAGCLKHSTTTTTTTTTTTPENSRVYQQHIVKYSTTPSLLTVEALIGSIDSEKSDYIEDLANTNVVQAGDAKSTKKKNSIHKVENVDLAEIDGAVAPIKVVSSQICSQSEDTNLAFTTLQKLEESAIYLKKSKEAEEYQENDIDIATLDDKEPKRPFSKTCIEADLFAGTQIHSTLKLTSEITTPTEFTKMKNGITLHQASKISPKGNSLVSENGLMYNGKSAEGDPVEEVDEKTSGNDLKCVDGVVFEENESLLLENHASPFEIGLLQNGLIKASEMTHASVGIHETQCSQPSKYDETSINADLLELKSQSSDPLKECKNPIIENLIFLPQNEASKGATYSTDRLTLREDHLLVHHRTNEHEEPEQYQPGHYRSLSEDHLLPSQSDDASVLKFYLNSEPSSNKNETGQESQKIRLCEDSFDVVNQVVDHCTIAVPIDRVFSADHSLNDEVRIVDVPDHVDDGDVQDSDQLRCKDAIQGNHTSLDTNKEPNQVNRILPSSYYDSDSTSSDEYVVNDRGSGLEVSVEDCSDEISEEASAKSNFTETDSYSDYQNTDDNTTSQDTEEESSCTSDLMHDSFDAAVTPTSLPKNMLLMQQFLKAKRSIVFSDGNSAKNDVEVKNSAEVEVIAIDDSDQLDSPEPPEDRFLEEAETTLNDETSWLGDTIIHRAQCLLKQQHTDFRGLHDPLLRTFPLNDGKFVQVLNVNSNHWLCIDGNGDNIVRVYDSLGLVLNRYTLHRIARIVRTPESELVVIREAVQLQDNTNDCGLYAIAFAVDIVNGVNPSGVRYRKDELRMHLLQCFKDGVIVPFPRRVEPIDNENAKISPNIESKEKSNSMDTDCKKIPDLLCENKEEIQNCLEHTITFPVLNTESIKSSDSLDETSTGLESHVEYKMISKSIDVKYTHVSELLDFVSEKMSDTLDFKSNDIEDMSDFFSKKMVEPFDLRPESNANGTTTDFLDPLAAGTEEIANTTSDSLDCELKKLSDPKKQARLETSDEPRCECNETSHTLDDKSNVKSNDATIKPSDLKSSKVLVTKSSIEKYDVFCTCRDVFFADDVEEDGMNFMAECVVCGEWYHRKCVHIPAEVFVEAYLPWACPLCTS